ncbi:hypothetical protein [Alkalihalobacterium sp. APHAB7]|uniref:hypothetical protein n=1 Tax=Alkalihalobacterium sp. APHAB7 TaxID=3402081 RepID=UPI003AAFF6A7
MTSVKDLFLSTKRLLDYLEKPMEKEERDDYIEQLQEHIDERQQLIENFNGKPQTSEEKKMAVLMVEWNKKINESLNSHLLTVRTDITQLKKQKDTGKKYENSYDHEPIDGFFFDKRK